MTLKPLRHRAIEIPSAPCRWPLCPPDTMTVCGEPGCRKYHAPKFTLSAVTSSASS